ncbi:MAG TPA: winged helix DNA-binding domain-containing protein [Gemmatimonadaceae bacterium]|nr:winged helix DNA-binding domain-containing protein [Gemmatimonadaceae bacterium]
MRLDDVARHRLHNQHIQRPTFDDPAKVVRWFGAVQAQEFFDALWAVGLRTRGALKGTIERAIAERTIVRTWPMRGTLHFVAPDDAHWMLKLLTPRVIAASASRHRQLELDLAVFRRAEKVLISSLRGGKALTRPAIYEKLNAAGIRTHDSRGLHILGYLAQRGVICFGARDGKQATFVLLDEWVPNARALDRHDALVELARRYITSHGPATVHDFAWWAGLTVADAREGLEGASLRVEQIEGRSYWLASVPRIHGPKSSRAYLLPVYDEYTVAYRDRSAVLDPKLAKHVNAGGGVLRPIVVIDGRVMGTWKRSIEKGAAIVTITSFTRLPKYRREAIEDAAARYARFLGTVTRVQHSH